MAYKKPICDCNTELIYSTELVYLTQIKINKNGKLSKNKKLMDRYEYGVYDHTGYEIERLSCPNCNKWYVCEYDDKKRVIRGNTI